jgi:protein-tyrosine phosphatase
MLLNYSKIILFTILSVLYSCNGENRDEPAIQKEEHNRHIVLDGQPNFRDIGGYKTVDGKTVKWGQVFRSGELPRLSDEDVKKLEFLGINNVISFLTQPEIDAKGEDHLPEGVKEISIPIDTEDGTGGLAEEILIARQTGDFTNVPVEINPEIHRLLINKANKEYAQLIREVLDSSNRPIVFHCSHGIHRTGTATALLLSILGVPWETIQEDYLLSNTYRKEEVEHRLEQLRELAAKNQGIAPEEVDMANTNAFYILDGKYIDAALDETVKKYGSMENHIKEGLGITEEEIQMLKYELLE